VEEGAAWRDGEKTHLETHRPVVAANPDRVAANNRLLSGRVLPHPIHPTQRFPLIRVIGTTSSRGAIDKKQT
jgi:hypothetical protein